MERGNDRFRRRSAGQIKSFEERDAAMKKITKNGRLVPVAAVTEIEAARYRSAAARDHAARGLASDRGGGLGSDPGSGLLHRELAIICQAVYAAGVRVQQAGRAELRERVVMPRGFGELGHPVRIEETTNNGESSEYIKKVREARRETHNRGTIGLVVASAPADAGTRYRLALVVPVPTGVHRRKTTNCAELQWKAQTVEVSAPMPGYWNESREKKLFADAFRALRKQVVRLLPVEPAAPRARRSAGAG
jgi:hypothetical protein